MVMNIIFSGYAVLLIYFSVRTEKVPIYKSFFLKVINHFTCRFLNLSTEAKKNLLPH